MKETAKGELRSPDDSVWILNADLDGTDFVLHVKRSRMLGIGDDAYVAQCVWSDGEIREQLVCRVNLHPRWGETVLRRYAKLGRSEATPQKLLPLKAG